MADNIKIVGSILSTSQVSRYETDDLRLITSLNIKKSFDPFNDYIEYYVYDITSNPLEDNYNYRSYKLPTDESLNPGVTPDLNTTNQTATGAQVGTVSNLSTTSSTYPIIEIDPVQDLQNLGYSSGEFKVQYNIFKNKISSYPSAELFIKEISPDRTEIRVGSVVLTNDQIETGSLALIESYTTSSIFDPFLLNFGNNIQELVTNIVLNRVDTGYEILFKLYNTLDDSITEKSSLWVVEEISTPYVFDINLDAILSAPTGSTLRGPNFSNISRFGLNSTDGPYENQFANDQEGLFKLNNSQSIDININYSGNGSGESGFGSFVTFGSAFSRVHNFYTKVQQIENYNNLIAQYPTYNLTSGSLSGSFSSSLQSEINTYSASINSIISNFDGFENYLYFESGSLVSTSQYGITPYPKSGSYKPYVLLSTTSSTAGIWYASSSLNAEDYDLNNVDYFKYSVPGYVVDDPDNENYITFLNMMGQFFDNIWIYIKTIPEINLANNNLEIGISKDLVYNMLQSLGVSIFNSFGNQSIANYLLGANTGSASYNGYLTDFSATGSYINNISKKDILAESYKRIYHNLPLLLQRKGTVAGLRTLLSTFGIPNQDSYTIISGSFSSSYYTPTGSIITSSVLNVKEYGGSTTEGLLAGYNNDKVRIVDNVTASVAGTFGSVLSPYTSILQYTTASSNFRTADEHYVDISFSPQTQLDTYVSKSIASVNTNWSIDDYIGNPQQLYSGSYSNLDNQRKIYFVDGTGSYKGFTNIFYELNNGTYISGSITGSYEKIVSGLDYNRFIRLIQFFDNSMFKMLEDYVPARTSLSTGVTISSPVLERNKWSYAQPKAINELEKDGSIVAPVLESVYDPYYSKLSGSRVAYFDGAIEGTNMDIYNGYFVPSNFNPYLGDLSLYNSGKSIYQQISSNTFIHSDFNILQNNVSQSLYSFARKTLEISGSSGYIGKGSHLILTTASLQDSYLSLDSYTLPRYEGVKISSATYNKYTSASLNYNGDYSYGKTATIDHYVRKFGLFTQIVSSSFFPSRNLTSLKYLVDESGSLTELSQTPIAAADSHWAELQNTFKLGKSTTVALFDNQQYSNQKTTDGGKNIFDSGYSYYPILYYSGSDSKLFFQYTGKGTGILSRVNNGGYFIGSTPTGSIRYDIYNLTSGTGSLYSAFDVNDDNFSAGNSYYSNIRRGTAASFPTYSVPQDSNMAFSANFGIDVRFPSATGSVTYKFDMFYNPSGSIISSSIGSQTQTFTPNTSTLASTLVFNVTSSFRDFVPSDRITFQLIQFNLITGSLGFGNFTASLARTGDGTVYDGLRNSIATSGINPFASPVSGQFISGSNGVDTLILNQSLSSFNDYLYLSQTSSADLHPSYGNVDNTFSPKVGDTLLIYYNNNTQYQELNISSVSVGTKTSLTVSPNLVTNLAIGSYNSNTVSKLILLSKVADETNINLVFDKEDGQTSYGFLIPENLSPDVLQNIDTITRQVKVKILTDQSGITLNIS
jgi:hypothetical protein